MSQDMLTVATALIAAVAGYVLKWQQNARTYERETQINERDLLSRIDGLQKQILDMANENAQLRAEIEGLRHELRYLRGLGGFEECRTKNRRRDSGERLIFHGDDYSEGDYD